ncbi:MAG: hypothetical protein ACI9KE_004652 [Polyangiales bacterium]|jgi:hypothetical protein
MRPFILVLSLSMLGVVLPGCTLNATLDGELRLPARPDGFDSLFVVVAVRRDDTFEDPWEGTSLPQVHELGPSPTTYSFSLETEEFMRNAFIRIQLCRTEGCQDLQDPVSELWYELQQPFYQGQQTSWDLELPRFPLCRDEACTSFTTPAESDGPAVRLCNAVSSADFPVWRCNVGRCEIGCGLVSGMPTGGSCQGGDGGLHFCE